MPVEVVWSILARQDLLDHYLAIGAENRLAAERIYDRIELRSLQLMDHPRMGPRRPDIRPSTRVLVEAPFLILYETSPDRDEGPVVTGEIVRVIDGRRDLERLF
ncbi:MULTISPECIES: type II toxin-antitoxin system RelE/ParE family toxin [unclassified Methylobacterium]|jgi:toxin ParE1/3/4|uniref:type II toxin-antitoxin system RelE/ParE family toxin n=1 Tax=unclassified Methylobacterium TaxID=2615210 RepID=UPI0006F4C77D|nr:MULTISPECIES: type II toxin-antitoxin system RelE/ParE family toxin [unclassified Methylobacterium]KQO71762.1 plasmid stabilization protein [Methylobacterium sp. Leaf87]KQP35075.1 plasmid stabilization protein [Methylobacterium sp. Leaf100]